MVTAKVFVSLKRSVLDPEGKTIKHALETMGYSDVADVRCGKSFDLTVDASKEKAEQVVKEICDKLLANPVIEEYRYEIE